MAVIYLGGFGGQLFVGSCILSSNFYKVNEEEMVGMIHYRSFLDNKYWISWRT